MWEAPEDAPCAYKGNEYLGYHDTRSFKIRVDSVLETVVACCFFSFVALEPQIGLDVELN